MKGKTCVVTGANTGIGKEIARVLAQAGAKVILACRSQERGEAALAELKADTHNDDLELRLVDLSRQESIRTFARSLIDDLDRLDVLVNNAGVWLTEKTIGPDGIELTFGVNVLGYFLLSNLLVPLLEKSAPARIVNVASKMAGKLDIDDVQLERRGYNGTTAYSQSKQANRMLSWELAERLAGKNVTVNVMHPGPVKTELARNGKGIIGAGARVFFSVFGRTPQQGADTASWLAMSPDVEGVTGKFWQDRKEQRRKFYDPPQNKALWERCEAMLKEPSASG